MRIGTRSTPMALAQTGEAVRLLNAAFPGLDAVPAPFRPLGDRDQVSTLQRHGGKGGAFVAEIRAALGEGRIEAAMHSLKDMPGDEDAPGLVIAAMLAREAAGDALVLHPELTVDEFFERAGAGLRIGTNAVRRAAYLRRLYPHAEVIHYRGGADTRLKKLDERRPQKLLGGGETPPADALVVARAGLERLSLANRIVHDFSFTDMLPAVGQGVVAIECPAAAFEIRAKLAEIDDADTRATGEAEREMLWILNGHCNSPIAGHARRESGRLELKGAVLSPDGARLIETVAEGPADRPRELGRKVGMALLDRGARSLIGMA